MEIDNLVLFNHWRNGDTFINRNYVKHIISKLNVPSYYAHKNHEANIRDLNCRIIGLSDIPKQCNMSVISAYDKANKTFYINTWVGAWIGKILKPGDHANFVTLHKVWNELYSQIFNGEQLPGNYFDFLPTIDYSVYDLSKSIEWLKDKQDVVLVCNGKQQSEQSSMGYMLKIINVISQKYNNVHFLVCDKVGIERENVTYTDDIFGSSIGNLPHISYMSQYAKLIIGKNSGPFSFSHTKETCSDSNKTFLCFSKEMKHCLCGEGMYYANHLFSNTVDDDYAIKLISNQIDTMNSNKVHEMKHIMLAQ